MDLYLFSFKNFVCGVLVYSLYKFGSPIYVLSLNAVHTKPNSSTHVLIYDSYFH